MKTFHPLSFSNRGSKFLFKFDNSAHENTTDAPVLVIFAPDSMTLEISVSICNQQNLVKIVLWTLKSIKNGISFIGGADI